MMADEPTGKQSTKGPGPNQFVFRASFQFLKTLSLIFAVICFVTAAASFGFAMYGVLLFVFAGKPMNNQYFAAGIFSSLIVGLFGRWFLQKSEFLNSAKSTRLEK